MFATQKYPSSITCIFCAGKGMVGNESRKKGREERTKTPLYYTKQLKFNLVKGGFLRLFNRDVTKYRQ